MASQVWWVLGLTALAVFGFFGLTSLLEGERRAARLAFGLAAIGALLFYLASLLPQIVQVAVLGGVASLVAAGVCLLLLPIGEVVRGNDEPQVRVDERDIMFARARLIPDTEDYQAYYAMRPENAASDAKTRALPGLLAADAREANPLIFASTGALFAFIGELQDAVDGPIAPQQIPFDTALASFYLKELACYLGAHTAGIADVQPCHVYTHIGRGSGQYGAPVTLNHRHAIAFTVEMDAAMTGAAPAAPTLLESARQYARAAQIAIQLALFIRSQGYPARAHIDGNYRVIAPLVARDAGLGEFGRMGLLMTPSLGPRVRLGIVTTDLPLLADGRSEDTSVLDFCRVCQKCADCCPVKAIPYGERAEIDGALRWRINHDICYRYWNVIGTDCARCMAVCPYSHPDNLAHNVVRWAARKSGFARRAAILADRAFYGTAPAARSAPAWVPGKADGSP